MPRPKILAILATAAFGICGVNAGLCQPSSTTSTAITCQETQVISNPSFDIGDGSPWKFNGASVADGDTHTGPNTAQVVGLDDVTSGSFSQTLYNLEPGTYLLKFYYTRDGMNPEESAWAFCSISAYLGDDFLVAGSVDNSGPVFIRYALASTYWTTELPVDLTDLSFSVICGGKLFG
ncbi:hypothetical protein B0T10DRAFT_554156 [Thelonectria olida]|uniref:Uncharacterized protein n=1 Tax=Thelonectria olida TaxID=1576542 RepID=A0A9P8VQD5_9HYPO|nr:hypothetical protein B0T10DRAFT_554156 [Thelonectria olida]